MSVTIGQSLQGACVISIAGRFDFSSHPEFRAAFAALAPSTEVIVDFSATTYIDSAALGMLLLLRDRVGDARHIKLANCKGQPDQVLRIANFHKLFRYENQ
ncbi:MAG TPA: STAS domain-containing protein [Polyangiaceae bacterium]|jgi:anti-anti-sigma factor|nr:STAS domain-containing protein [Polyangiaceae bacterium]